METTPVTTNTPPEARRVARLIIGMGRPPLPPKTTTPPPAWKPGPSVTLPGKNKDTAQLATGAKRRKPPEDLRRELATNAAAPRLRTDSLSRNGDRHASRPWRARKTTADPRA